MGFCMILQDTRITLQKIERAYCEAGSTRAAARIDIARALKIGTGTLENLIRDRVKSIDAGLFANIKALWVKTIEAKQARLEHELELARKIDLAISPSDMDAAETLLAEAREFLRGKGGTR
jgi:hypothetical protein